ncbi:MAG TPA: undecaprenyldiphospho-muramoylpentapeptide beta-N-acetylglucosaminyltransferase [Thermoanaerobaculia bacterium]
MRNPIGAYVIAAGKTGGHIFPGIALAREVQARRPSASIVFVGTTDGLETRLVPEAGFPLEAVSASGFVGKSLSGKVRALLQLPRGFLQARRILQRYRARAVAGMGGYVSVPVLFAARSLGIPTLIHDSDALPGMSTRGLNRIATRTAVGVAAANARLAKPGVVTGTPVRPEFFFAPDLESHPAGNPPRVLVFGGSQGSSVLNRAMADAARELAGDGIAAIHQTGDRHLDATRRLYEAVPEGWSLEPFLPRLWEPLGWCDLVVARAGAMTLAELAAAGRPAVLVPFAAAAHGHQLVNARAFAAAGAGVTIEERDLSGPALAEAIRRLLADRRRLAEMGRNARALAVTDAATRLADLLFEAEAAVGRAA